jgi:hypothetical protein
MCAAAIFVRVSLRPTMTMLSQGSASAAATDATGDQDLLAGRRTVQLMLFAWALSLAGA